MHFSLVSRRAWYSATIDDFLQTDPDTIIGRLTRNSDFTVLPSQRDAWLGQIAVLQSQFHGLTGALFLEFTIPRMGKRIDAVLILGPAIFAIEFKVGQSTFDRSSIDQVWDYALDLKNFHEGSHHAAIIPILVATGAEHDPSTRFHRDRDHVFRPLTATPSSLRATIDQARLLVTGDTIDAGKWASAAYRPTPTIIEAARALYAQHSVEAIARYDAGATNLAVTSRRVQELVNQAQAERRKLICFATGVPGAGKTLVGLNIATQRRDAAEPTHAVFLSGNGPLVAVLREALTRDEVARRRSLGHKVRKSQVGESVKAFIQNVHHFRDDLLADQQPPAEHVAIFDEAQRAWNAEQTAKFMQRRRNHRGFEQSEPEFLIAGMDRHRDWAVIVCLVGGGQEINTGEAGIDTWISAVQSRFPHWQMYISSRLTDSEYGSGAALDAIRSRPDTFFDDSLHLAVSMRSFRAENVSAFVKALLDCDVPEARHALSRFIDRYPILVTRDLDKAKEWVREQARGTQRYGLVASSKAHRLKPQAIDVRVEVDPVHWFLNDRYDTRSSFYLEDAATEFQVQGLELDWACVAWDGDLRFLGNGWGHHHFRGDRWCKVHDAEKQRYLNNAYRVLLTRARQGMVIYVPDGNPRDPTRLPEYYDSTYRYLLGLGIPEVH